MEKQKTMHEIEQNPGPFKQEVEEKEEDLKVESPKPSELGKRILKENCKLFLHPVVKVKRMKIIEDIVITQEINITAIYDEDEEFIQLYQDYLDLLKRT